MESNTKYRIDNKTAILMVLTAVFLDIISFFISLVGTLFGVCIFFFWYHILGIPFISPKQMVNWFLNMLGEGISLGWWLGLTAGVIITIIITRTEDRLGVDVMGKINAKNPSNVASKATTTAQRMERKTARRIADPQRAARAEERLNRLRAQKQMRGT